MSADLVETLKWVVGLPAALLALLSIPHVFMKYRLECRKLRYEVRKLEAEFPSAEPSTSVKQPGAVFTWMAHYWAIPCYGSMVILGIVAGLLRSPVIAATAVGTSLILFVTGSAITERYTRITGRST